MLSLFSDFDGALAIGFGAGVYLFFRGFRIYRKYRVLADTPTMPIRSIPMGLVEIHGKAKGERTANSPVSNTPCFFYKVDIEAYKRGSKGRGRWRHVATDLDGVPFYLEDQTGKVLVDAHGAEFDLIQSGRRETRSATSRGLRRVLWGEGDPTLTTGTQVSDSSLVTYAESVIAGKRDSLFGDSLVGNLAEGSLALLAGGESPTGQYRLAEYCILPNHWYDVTGTCTENPNPKDEHDRNLLVKGQNEPTFLISWRSERGIEQSLRNRAALHIFGGVALSLVCLGILLSRLGWL